MIFKTNILECYGSHLTTENSVSNLSSFVCDLVCEISNHGMQSVAIIKMSKNFSSTFTDDLHKCLPSNVTIVQPSVLMNEGVYISQSKIDDIKLIIALVDNFNGVSLTQRILTKFLNFFI